MRVSLGYEAEIGSFGITTYMTPGAQAFNFMGMIVAANMIGQICFLKTTSSMTIKGTRSFTIQVQAGAAI